MESGDFEAVLASQKERVGKRRRQARLAARVYLVAVGLWVIIYTACFLLEKSVGCYPLPLVIAATALTAASIAAHIHTQVRLNAEEIGAAAELASYDDPRVIAPLVEELRLTDNDARPLVVKALIRLLPCLRAEDAGILDAQQRAFLYGALLLAADTTSGCHDVPFAFAIMESLPKIGDDRALRLLKRLEEEAGREDRVRKAARECLPLLTARLERLREAETLLRPSDAAPNVLLRPAEGRGDQTPEDQLLRPSS
jgi:HEAT repeat protein